MEDLPFAEYGLVMEKLYLSPCSFGVLLWKLFSLELSYWNAPAEALPIFMSLSPVQDCLSRRDSLLQVSALSFECHAECKEAGKARFPIEQPI